MRLLMDHKAELGNRTVEKIVVAGGVPGIANKPYLRDDFTRSRSFFSSCQSAGLRSMIRMRGAARQGGV